MTETTTATGDGPERSTASKLAFAAAFVVAAVYTALFAAGWSFLAGATVALTILYVALPYVRAAFGP